MGWKELIVAFVSLVVIANGQQHAEKIRKLPNDKCGVSSSTSTNGPNAVLGEFPWMAAVGYKDTQGHFQWLCSGSLITDQYVVTTAHCFHDYYLKGNAISAVRLGDINLNSSVVDKASPMDFDVEKTIMHPDYPDNWSYNDIGLIKLRNKVTFDAAKSPICLPTESYFNNTSFENQQALLVSWGHSEQGNTTALRKTVVKIEEQSSCSNTSRITQNIKDERTMCASSPIRDDCEGDSGGPLIVAREHEGKNRMYLLGVNSYGVGCGRVGYPDIYTKVSYFIDWIVGNMEL